MELSTETVRGLSVRAGLKTAELEGARLAYVERGQGQPVVLVHGSISDLTIWEPQLEPIGASYRRSPTAGATRGRTRISPPEPRT
jgi:hypothetical protein